MLDLYFSCPLVGIGCAKFKRLWRIPQAKHYGYEPRMTAVSLIATHLSVPRCWCNDQSSIFVIHLYLAMQMFGYIRRTIQAGEEGV